MSIGDHDPLIPLVRPPPPWRILLIGGSSGTGKTVAGRRLADSFGISLLLVDDIRMAIQAVIGPQERPAFHPFIVEGTDAGHSSETVFAGLIAVAKAMEPALRMIMAHHLAVEGAGPVIIEGDGILPRLMSTAYLKGQPEFLGIDLGRSVKGVILFEAELEKIIDHMLSRGRGFQKKPAPERRAFSEGSWQYGLYLTRQAKTWGVQTLTSYPFETLSERMEKAIIG